VTVVEGMRAEIERLGGEYRFGARVVDLEVAAGPDGARRMRGLVLEDGEAIEATHVVLAPGHSARDLFATLLRRGVAMEAKPFSIGVRIEHPQRIIDRARFGPNAGNKLLGAADYRLAHHCANGRAVYSFCMCPGGRVVAATSEPGHVVTNGMSQYSRAEFNANAGIVVGISPADYPGGVLAGVEFQRAGSAPPSRPAAATTAPRRSAWRTSSPAAPRPRSARSRPATSPAPARRTCPPACRTTRWRPCAKPCPPSPGRCPASPWPTR
jgi:uncharacterized FAD-dependent dehydrogenase